MRIVLPLLLVVLTFGLSNAWAKPHKKKRHKKTVHISFEHEKRKKPIKVASVPKPAPVQALSESSNITYIASPTMDASVETRSSDEGDSAKFFRRVIAFGGYVMSAASGQYSSAPNTTNAYNYSPYAMGYNTNNNSPRNSQSSNGLTGGALVDLGFGMKNLVLESGLVYRRIGVANSGQENNYAPYAVSYSGYNNDFHEYLTMDYLGLSVAGKYYFNLGEDFALYGKLGLVPSMLVGQRYEYYSQSQQLDKNEIPGVKTFEFGGQAALGAKYAISGGFELLIEASYYRGLTSFSSYSDIYNSAFNFAGGLALKL